MSNGTQLTEQLEDCTTDAALFALGTLPLEKAHAVELRMRSGCAFCCSQVEHFSVVAEHLSLCATPVEPPKDLRSRLLNRLKLQDTAAEPTQNRKVIRGHDAPWLKMPIPGVEIRPLVGEKTFLLRMQPGSVFPKHDHPQAEQCYVLEGSITDSDGLTLRAGDFIVMSSGIVHDPIRSPDGCTLFISYAD